MSNHKTLELHNYVILNKYIYICILSILAFGCASHVENILQEKNRDLYFDGTIPYSEYRERDNYLDKIEK